MSSSNYNYERIEGNAGIKMWTKGVSIEDKAMQQLRDIATLPFIFKHVAVMPDVHWGIGATIGSVIATESAIIPAAVGVDLGCGMMAWQLSLKASDLPDNLLAIRTEIEKAVPHGRTDNGGANDRGAWHDVPNTIADRWAALSARYQAITDKNPKASSKSTARQLGSLGTGNHFIEICLDEEQNVWIMLHSGSRGPGNAIGRYFINKAKEEMEKHHIVLANADLAYLSKNTEVFDDYVEGVKWAQDYALENRYAMMYAVIEALGKHVRPFTVTQNAVNCHHNYVAWENHFNTDVIVTRKGAVRAQKGDLGIIPGSMGTGSFIVRGLGNPDSFCSCSHGAGRVMSRNQAKKTISQEDHIKAMEGIEARTDKDVIDESPAAYKDVNAVIAAQSDLIEVVYRLRQVVNVKG